MKLLNASQDHAKHVRASAHCGQFLDFMLFQFIVTFIYILAFLSKMNMHSPIALLLFLLAAGIGTSTVQEEVSHTFAHTFV